MLGRVRLLAGTVAAAVLAAGCSPLGATPAATPPSPASTPPPSSQSPVAQAQATHEYPSPPPPAESVPGAAPSQVQAIRAFANSYINWSAATVAGQMRALARDSVGQARSAMALAAAQSAQDYELQRGGIGNRGTIEAIAPLLGHPYQYIVVTEELTTASASTAYQGLRPAWHLALASVVAPAAGQWVVSGWQPEN